MPITKIEIDIDIPEGFEFDRIDANTKDGDYNFSGGEIECHDISYSVPTIILRKKKPETRWFRAYIRIGYNGTVISGTYDNVLILDIDHFNKTENDNDFIEWITPWIEYSIEPKEKK